MECVVHARHSSLRAPPAYLLERLKDVPPGGAARAVAGTGDAARRRGDRPAARVRVLSRRRPYQRPRDLAYLCDFILKSVVTHPRVARTQAANRSPGIALFSRAQPPSYAFANQHSESAA